MELLKPHPSLWLFPRFKSVLAYLVMFIYSTFFLICIFSPHFDLMFFGFGVMSEPLCFVKVPPQDRGWQAY